MGKRTDVGATDGCPVWSRDVLWGGRSAAAFAIAGVLTVPLERCGINDI